MSDAAVRRLAAAHYRERQRLAAVVASKTKTLWSQVDPSRIAGSWPPVGGRIAAVVTAAQVAAAQTADAYVGAVLSAQGAAGPPDGAVIAAQFGGAASDGRQLGSLLFTPVADTLTDIGAGRSTGVAMRSGLARLQRIAVTQVQDAGRTADGVSTTAHRQASGYIRVLTPPSCARCAVLAGRWYAWNAAFDRHPRCDCTSAAAAGQLDDLQLNVGEYFGSLPAGQQDAVFTRAGAQAIRDGADINQVVNARRGMAPAGGLTTSEGTTRRGAAGQLLGPGARRLTPEGVYRIASTRDEAVDLLRRHGYLA